VIAAKELPLFLELITSWYWVRIYGFEVHGEENSEWQCGNECYGEETAN
jgi:hypothetical protein